MKCVYVGELSGCFIDDLKLEVARGVPFEAPDAWVTERVRLDPERWRTTTDAVPTLEVGDPQAEVRLPNDPEPGPFPQPKKRPSA